MGLWKCKKAAVTKTIVLSVINTAGPAFRIIPFILCLSLSQKDQIHLARSDMQNFVGLVKRIIHQASSINVSGSGKLTLEELKMMMEKLGAPQTHLGLKAMIQVKRNQILIQFLF